MEKEINPNENQPVTPASTTRLVNTEIHNVQGVVVSGGQNEIHITIHDGKVTADATNKPLTEERLKEQVDRVKTNIENDRLWFVVCKYMMRHGLVLEGQFAAAVDILEHLYPGLRLNAKDLSSMNVLCFCKPFEEWKDADAPVHGAWFDKYHSLAKALEAR